MLHSFINELQTAWFAFQNAMGEGHLVLLLAALFVACAFEFINGFHDTANAVATVIYTGSLRPRTAVVWSGFCNFFGVFLGGISVAMGIVKLLPLDLLVTNQLGVSLAMVFALLFSAIAWNLGTWYLGLPASSSHTLIGSILGIGVANALLSHVPLSTGINWGKASEIGLSLLVSPALGFGLAGLLLLIGRRLVRSPVFHQPPVPGQAPPWAVRAALIFTSSGVSLAHGSNDGQKGVGLIMLILIAILPAHFALKPGSNAQDIARLAQASHRIEERLQNAASMAHSRPHGASRPGVDFVNLSVAAAVAPSSVPAVAIAENYSRVSLRLASLTSLENASTADRMEIRAQLLKSEQALAKLEKNPNAGLSIEDWEAIRKDRAILKGITEYAPTWVILMVALSIGTGTMIGWRRIVVTIGEKIGKSHLTYAQGVASEVVAMSTIGISSLAGLPVSTTHILSSGIAGTMVAGRSGLQLRTIRSIALAWLLTLPVSMTLSGLAYALLLKLVA